MNKKDKQIVKDLADILGRLSKYFEKMADDNIEENVLKTNYHDFYILDKYLGWDIKKALVFKRDIKEFKKDMEKSYIIHYDKFGKCGAKRWSDICYHNYFPELQEKKGEQK
jgi:hypothetical protein